MKQYLTKVAEFAGPALTKLLNLGRWVVGQMRSVQIDQPRGAILSAVLQLGVLAALIALAASSHEVVPPRTGDPTPAAAGNPPPAG